MNNSTSLVANPWQVSVNTKNMPTLSALDAEIHRVVSDKNASDEEKKAVFRKIKEWDYCDYYYFPSPKSRECDYSHLRFYNAQYNLFIIKDLRKGTYREVYVSDNEKIEEYIYKHDSACLKRMEKCNKNIMVYYTAIVITLIFAAFSLCMEFGIIAKTNLMQIIPNIAFGIFLLSFCGWILFRNDEVGEE